MSSSAARGLLFPQWSAMVAATDEGWLCYQATSNLRAVLSGKFGDVIASVVAVLEELAGLDPQGNPNNAAGWRNLTRSVTSSYRTVRRSPPRG